MHVFAIKYPESALSREAALVHSPALVSGAHHKVLAVITDDIAVHHVLRRDLHLVPGFALGRHLARERGGHGALKRLDVLVRCTGSLRERGRGMGMHGCVLVRN